MALSNGGMASTRMGLPALSKDKVLGMAGSGEATKEHPVQVEMCMEDIWVGTWTTTKFSGAIPAAARNMMLERVRKVSDAVKSAREQANGIEVKPQKLGDALLTYIFDGR